MASRVKVPTPLRTFTQGQDEVSVDGATVREILDNLEKACPGIGERIRDGEGNVRRFVNVYVNGEDINHLDGLDSSAGDGAVLSIVPAIAGG